MTSHLLIVEDDVVLGPLLARKFEAMGWHVTCCESLAAAQSVLCVETDMGISPASLSHCILDLNVGHQSGLRLIPEILAHSPDCKIVVLTGYASVQTTIEAIKLGAIYLLAKPSGIPDILRAFSHLADPEHVRIDTHAKSGMAQHSWETIQQALRDNGFNVSKTAETLGMHRRTLQRKLKKPF
jgi:two-component system response regulator RegA